MYVGDASLVVTLSDIDEEIEAVLDVAKFEQGLLEYGIVRVVLIRRLYFLLDQVFEAVFLLAFSLRKHWTQRRIHLLRLRALRVFTRLNS